MIARPTRALSTRGLGRMDTINTAGGERGTVQMMWKGANLGMAQSAFSI